MTQITLKPPLILLEWRCPNCGRLILKYEAPVGRIETKCHSCAAVVRLHC